MALDNTKRNKNQVFHWNRDSAISPDRLMAFTDGVFAIAITLLILGLELPETSFTTGSSLVNFMLSVLPFMSTINISFIILGGFWVYHHEFVRVKRVTVPFLWLSIIYLLIVMYVPFTISIVSRYVQFVQASILFGAVMSFSALWLLLMFYYAEKKDLLVDDLKFEKKFTYKTIIIITLLIVIVSLLSFFISPQLEVLYLLMPIYSSFSAVRHEKIKINNQRTSIEDLLKEPIEDSSKSAKSKSVKVVKSKIKTNSLDSDRLEKIKTQTSSIAPDKVETVIKDELELYKAPEKLSLTAQYSAECEESFKNEIEYLVKMEILRKLDEYGFDFYNMTNEDRTQAITEIRHNIMAYVDEAVNDEIKKYS